ncbi:MAG: hypothetical protein J1G02_04780 [Clostridiales bacterium]|nr:hypothetical protein [Clostridiales bacterium]
MKERFAQLKRRYVLATILKSVVVGVACGLTAVGVTLLALKLSALNIHAGYYALIGAIAALIAGGVAYLAWLPTDVKVAKKLDTEYALNERVQTALAYQGESGDIFALQRDDTASVLNGLKIRKITFKQVWKYLLVGVLSVALVVVAVVIPARAVNGGNVNPPTPPPTPGWEELPFTVSQAQLERLQEVIEHVNSFELEQSLKESITATLGKLIEELPTVTSNGDMQYVTLSAIRTVDNSCKNVTSYYKIGTSLINMGRADLAKVIAAGAETYKNAALTDSSGVTSFYKNRVDLSDENMAKPLEQLLSATSEAFLHDVETANGIVSSIHLAIILSNVGANDALYLTLNDLTIALDEILANYTPTATVDGEDGQESNGDEELTPEQQALVAKLSETFRVFGYNLSDLLADQAYIFAVDKYVKNAVVEILGLTAETGANVSIGYDLTSLVNSTGGLPDDDENLSGGGYGEGDTKYGSDDLIYDPDTGEYVPYGQIINKYYAIVNELLNEGKLSEEQANIIRSYFEMLLSGIKNND